MEPDAQLDHRPDARAAADAKPSFGGPVNAGHQAKECALTGPVSPDDTDGFAGINGEADVTQRPEFLGLFAMRCVDESKEPFFYRPGAIVPKQEPLRQPF